MTERPSSRPGAANGAFLAVVFDLDGVLVDSETLNVRSAREAFSESGFALADGDVPAIVGRHPDDYLPELAARHGLGGRDVARVRAVQERLYRAWRADDARLLVPGAAEVPAAVRARGLATALATSSGRDHALACLERGGLAELFDAVVTGDDVEERKPAPHPYLKCAVELGVSSDRLLVVEDSIHGVRSAVAAGTTCFGVASPWTDPVTLRDAGARLVLPALPALLDHLG